MRDDWLRSRWMNAFVIGMLAVVCIGAVALMVLVLTGVVEPSRCVPIAGKLVLVRCD